jgi:tetraacyldisaccharide 4'-kinase
MKRGWIAILLWPLSILFYVLVQGRRALYAVGLIKSRQLPVPVIVVGNIFIGGTGKTPFTIWLVNILKKAGYHPGVISRGYGSDKETEKEALRPVQAHSLPQQVGDEPVLIASHGQCPVMVGRNRVEAACALLERYPEVDVIVSDDGLQHYGMKRDIEIALFDSRGLGNGWMIPAGPLREPSSRQCDFTIINLGSESPEQSRVSWGKENVAYMHLIPDTLQNLVDPTCTNDLQRLIAMQRQKGLRVVAAAGIGNPARYFSMLKSAGLAFTEMPLPDHYAFSDNPFGELSVDIILITEKDAVKCRHIEGIKNDPRLWVVPVKADIDRMLAEKIVEKLRGYTTA